jgi:hypothetical protein
MAFKIGAQVFAQPRVGDEFEPGEVIAVYSADFFFREYPNLRSIPELQDEAVIVGVKFTRSIKAASLEEFAKDFEVPVNNHVEKIYNKSIPSHHVFFLPTSRIKVQ